LSVAEDRLSLLPLYRPGWSAKDVDGDGAPFGPWRAGFLVVEARAEFGRRAVERAWFEGVTAMDADRWAIWLGQDAMLVWPGEWEALADREAEYGDGGGRAAQRSEQRSAVPGTIGFAAAAVEQLESEGLPVPRELRARAEGRA